MARNSKPAKPRKRAKGGRVQPAARRKSSAAPKRGVHDLGGLPAGRIDRKPHELTPFEERVDALMMLLTNQQGIYKVDSLRRTIEGFNAKEYAHLAYYEKWVLGIRRMLVEREVLTDAEIDAKIREIKARHAKGNAA